MEDNTRPSRSPNPIFLGKLLVSIVENCVKMKEIWVGGKGSFGSWPVDMMLFKREMNEFWPSLLDESRFDGRWFLKDLKE